MSLLTYPTHTCIHETARGLPSGGCRLKRGLYGLKQSGRLWYEQLGTALEGLGFKCLQSDPSIYIWMNDTTKVIIPVFINDLTLVSDSKQELDRVKEELSKIFKLKDLGPTTSLLVRYCISYF